MKSLPGLCVCGLLVVTAIGCGGSSEFVKVTGKVTLDGKPLQGARVTFHLKEGESGMPRKPGGTTDEDGNVTISYPKNSGSVEGAPIGDYYVTVRLQEGGDVDPSDEDADKAKADYAAKMQNDLATKQGNQATGAQPKDSTRGKSTIPEAYGSPTQSGLSVKVDKSGATFTLTLKGDFAPKPVNR